MIGPWWRVVLSVMLDCPGDIDHQSLPSLTMQLPPQPCQVSLSGHQLLVMGGSNHADVQLIVFNYLLSVHLYSTNLAIAGNNPRQSPDGLRRILLR